MKRILIAAIAIAVSSGFSGAVELEEVSAKDVTRLAQEARLEVPGPADLSLAGKAMKAASPITGAVDFKSPPFAELLVNSLKVTPELVVMAGGQSYVYKVGEGLVCYKSFSTDVHLPSEPRKARYSCVIKPAGGWKFMGMESYGSCDNRAFSLALYDALKVKEINDEGIRSKALELERPDGDGGTERNQLSCINPAPDIAAMGFRPTCQFLNAL